MIKQDKEQFIPDFAKPFIEEVNLKRMKKGDPLLKEEEIRDLIDKLDIIKNGYAG
ncbi:MAG: hypothetical protein HY980_02435 [Candidatus Magasanikbacteria bacterium]|jgi:hypothetical protein|nr:hypothetical protein [Candidatus Magasanikbacteria bacterium]